MAIRVLLNYQTAAEAKDAVRSWVHNEPEADLAVTREPGEARKVIRTWVDRGVDRVVAAGGDGTLHLVASVLLEANGAEGQGPALGLCPLGTGNDFARSIGCPTQPADALDRALRASSQPVDVLRADTDAPDAGPRWVVNAAAGGFSGEVDEVITREQKDRWGPLAFVLGAAELATSVPEYETVLQYRTEAGGPEQTWCGRTVNVICANGRTIGGGRAVAPNAKLSDGRMELVVLRAGSLPELAGAGTRLMAGAWDDHDLVDTHSVVSARIRSAPGLKFNVDGDLWTEGPVRIEVVEKALRIVPGSDAPAI
jgi:diacylglycerol kinase (ATP)